MKLFKNNRRRMHIVSLGLAGLMLAATLLLALPTGQASAAPETRTTQGGVTLATRTNMGIESVRLENLAASTYNATCYWQTGMSVEWWGVRTYFNHCLIVAMQYWPNIYQMIPSLIPQMPQSIKEVLKLFYADNKQLLNASNACGQRGAFLEVHWWPSITVGKVC